MLHDLDGTLILPGAIAVLGLVAHYWLFTQPTRIRLAVAFVFLAAYTYALYRDGILPLRPAPPQFLEERRIIVQAFEVLWWFSVARSLVSLGRVFLLSDHHQQDRKFATDLMAGAIYIGAVFAVVGVVFDLPITGLLATSGVVAIVLGLAMQSTLADLFSGIALNIERPYRIGDWIALEGDLEGVITEINWRATHLSTSTRDNVVVPNSIIAKSRIKNYSYPTRIHGVKFTVSFDDSVPPSRGIEILEHAVANCASALTDPRPKIRASGFGSSSVDYSVRFFVAHFALAPRAKSEVLDRIYRHSSWAGVSLATPRQEVRLTRSAAYSANADPAMRLLERMTPFAQLTPAERSALAAALSRREIGPGETIIALGEPGDSLFLIDRGVFAISRESADGSLEQIERLGPGEFFGEFALMTGQPRNATVSSLTAATVYEIRRADIAPLLKERGELKGELAKALALRQAQNESLPKGAERGVEEEANLAARLFDRIESFFRARH